VCGVSIGLMSPVIGAVPAKKDARLTLSGCVVAGKSDGSYMLTNVVVDGQDKALAPAHAFYRLESTKGLKSHIGHAVELTGVADLNDLDKGTLKVKTDEHGATTASIESERKTTKAEVGAESGLIPAAMVGSEGSMKVDIATYKFKISKVRMVAVHCAGAI
jgi:hypothetical protein